MSQSWKILLSLFYLRTQTLTAQHIFAEADQIIASSINVNVQPCDDFYAYACGNYNKPKLFQSNLMKRNLLDYGNHQYNTAIINLLETYGQQEHQLGESCRTLTQKVRNYFESCCKVTKRNVTRYLEEVKPGPDLDWPILENESRRLSKWPTNGKSFDILSLVAKLNSIGISGLIFTSTDYDVKALTLRISIAPFSPTSHTLLTDKEKLLNMLSSMGAENPAEILEDAFKTGNILANKAMRQEADLRICFGDLVKRYPNLNFKSYFFEKMGKQLPSNISVLIVKPSYFDDLNNAVWPSFDMSCTGNYMMMRYLNTFDGTSELDSMFCVNELREMFNMAINFLYYDHNIYYQEEVVKPDVKRIFRTVVDMLRQHIHSPDLKLTLTQIDSLKNRLASMRLNTGNFPASASCDMMEDLYSSVPSLDENNYYKNHLIMLRFNERKRGKAPFDMFSYEVPSLPHIVSSSGMKTIIVSYNNLMPPVYDFNYNNLGKYSLLGFILAHQLVIHCKLMHMNYTVDADSPGQASECSDIGLPLTLRRYDHVVNNVASKVVRKIATLKFLNLQPIESVPSWKKKFYFYVSQHFCNQDDNGYAFQDKQTDRLNRIAMYSEGFSQVFNCPKNSKMNPSMKCNI